MRRQCYSFGGAYLHGISSVSVNFRGQGPTLLHGVHWAEVGLLESGMCVTHMC